MIETAALLGVDSGPMEGFDADKVDELLGLKEKNLHATTMLALGFRGEDAYALLPKTRKAFDEVTTFID
jgi:nitroreductase